MDLRILSREIKKQALALGFNACGFCRADYIGDEQAMKLKNWLDDGYYAGMEYMARNFEKRCNPALLVDNAKSVICVALNYYPSRKQDEKNPQFAYYAYGKDYHDVMKAKLELLFGFIRSIYPDAEGRCFCDTAPLPERYWATKAGIGFVGKNTMLIIPGKGSFFFLGEIILDIELEYDEPIKVSCGGCTRCLDSCPTQALEGKYQLNPRKCISYQTIENKGEIDRDIISELGNCLYGCDICQQVCPWNRFAQPHNVPEFVPQEGLLDLSFDKLQKLSEDEYRRLFKGSAVKRAKYKGLMRNFRALKDKG